MNGKNHDFYKAFIDSQILNLSQLFVPSPSIVLDAFAIMRQLLPLIYKLQN